MPTYEYECTECKYIQEEVHPMTEIPQTTKCEKCGKKSEKIYSKGTSIHIAEGSDFYTPDGKY